MIRAIFWDIDGTLTDDQIHKVKHAVLGRWFFNSSEAGLVRGAKWHR
ncbi:MAG: hypothetical protein SFW66_00605 [Gammaproteobacteria bacterium]|nr:hypothetical protein [Gammaproteobacteria bacterium]